MGSPKTDEKWTSYSDDLRTYQIDVDNKAKAIVNAAESEPEKHASLVEETDRTGRVSGVYRKLQK